MAWCMDLLHCCLVLCDWGDAKRWLCGAHPKNVLLWKGSKLAKRYNTSTP